MEKIIVKKANENAVIVEMESIGLNDMQEIVGGLIECIRVADGVDMWLNDCGKLYNLPLNMVLGDQRKGEILDTIQGDIFFAGHNDYGDTVGLTDAQCIWVMNHFDNGEYAILQSENGIDFIPVWDYNPTAS